jgi:hypothetical protein
MKLARWVCLCTLAVILTSCGGSTPNGPTPTTPIVSSITPSTGPAGGGTAVRIAGANFSPGAMVTIGGVAATTIVVESATSITATTGAHAAGAADVAVSVLGRTGLLAAAFTYQAASVPPVISAITVRGPRLNQPANFADVGEEITVTAAVHDSDTPAEQLTYEWSAPSGTFVGTGGSVKWRAPSSAGTVTMTLAVSDGTRVTATAIVSVHDSAKEIGELARQFLLDFSDSSIRDPDYVLRGFSTSSRCVAGRDSEHVDVVKNREHYLIETWNIGLASVKVEFASRPCSFRPLDGDACAVVPALWNSLCLVTNPECVKGTHERAEGLDYVTAVFESDAWKLCASNWEPRDGIARPNFIR